MIAIQLTCPSSSLSSIKRNRPGSSSDTKLTACPGEHDQLFDGREMCSDVCVINERNRHSYRHESDGDFSLDYGITFVLSQESFLSAHQNARKVMRAKSLMYRH
jgi:hypothetical protein